MHLDRQYRSPWLWLALGLGVVFLRGLFLAVMDVDAAQYASIAMEMLQGGHWLQVQHQHADYLDKPPLLFWTAAFAFRWLGLHTWVYKLPSLLAVTAAVGALYRLARLYYPPTTARTAALVLASSVGLLLATNDVRTDALLLAMTTLAVWQAAESIDGIGNRWLHALLAGLFVGLAMLSKGPIGLVMPAFAIGSHLVLRRQWRQLFSLKWLAAMGVSAVLLFPMCWGLYQQFDLHPDKVVNGTTGVSGLRFFFWDQSFGRITGSNGWKNGASPFYFVQIYLWAFLPWPIFLCGALWQRGAELVRGGMRIAAQQDEALSIGGFLLTFVALSLSHYKLPHYIFITLPWASLLVARWFGSAPTLRTAWWRAEYLVFGLLAFVCTWLFVAAFPVMAPIRWLIVGGLFLSVAIACWRAQLPMSSERAVLTTALAGLATGFTLNFHFYPESLPFQSTITIPAYAHRKAIPSAALASFHRHGHALDFYAGQILPIIATAPAVADSARARGMLWLYTDEGGRALLDSARVAYRIDTTVSHFDVAQPSIRFLRATTRPATLQPIYLLEIPGQSLSGSSPPR